MVPKRRWIKLEGVEDSQLRLMGANEEFALVWHDVDLNLFYPDRVSLTGLHLAGDWQQKKTQSIITNVTVTVSPFRVKCVVLPTCSSSRQPNE